MNVEDQIREALLDELHRQVKLQGTLTIEMTEPGMLRIDGAIDLDDLVTALAGSLTLSQ